MKVVRHRNSAPYGNTTTLITQDASAYAMITVFADTNDVAVIHDIAVLDERKGEGLGSAILEEAVEEAKRTGADFVRLSAEPNSWMERWYKRHGFLPTGEVEELGKMFNVLERRLK